MVDKEVALEALSAILNANVRIKPRSQFGDFSGGAVQQQQQQLSIKHLIPTVLDADETSQVSRSNFIRMRSVLQGDVAGGVLQSHLAGPTFDTPTGKNQVIVADEFFDPQYDNDYCSLTDTETYRRGGEVYERPCGWYRFGLKVLNKYDGNAWLGTRYRSTQSVPGEWPVSYHGTSKKGAEGIIEGYLKPGERQRFGRGIYSTPYITVANSYAKTFTSQKDGKKYKAILQNRINPKYREIHNNGSYWLVPIPAGTSPTDEQKIVEQAIRPYGLLIKKV